MAEKKTPAPIDRPLSRAYLRNFAGWSTAYPPGVSEPNSCRKMENVLVERNGGLSVRPGLRYVSYTKPPDDPESDEQSTPGEAFDLTPVGSTEPFYLYDGSKALLFAVRETNGTVGFRVLNLHNPNKMVFRLTDEEIGFTIPQGESTLNFTSATRHVEYAQIDNKIIAMSDAGETARYFSVGDEKLAKRVGDITVPAWEDNDRLDIKHPDASWVLNNPYTVRKNRLWNPSFEFGLKHWNVPGSHRKATIHTTGGANGSKYLQVYSQEQRRNLVYAPLQDPASSIAGWHKGYGDPKLEESNGWLRLGDKRDEGLFTAHTVKCQGVEPGKKYKLAFTYRHSDDVKVKARLKFFRANGSQIGDDVKFDVPDGKDARYVSKGIEAPKGAASVQVHLGGNSGPKNVAWVRVKHVVLCRANESTDFFSGDSGTHYYWAGTKNKAPSFYWPPTDLTVTSRSTAVEAGWGVTGSIYAKCLPGSHNVTLTMKVYNLDGVEIASATQTQAISTSWTRLSCYVPANETADAARAKLFITASGMALWDVLQLDAGMIETDVLGDYFDGSTAGSNLVRHSWAKPHDPGSSGSYKVTTNEFTYPPAAETPTTETLIASGGDANNKYKMGFFYTFENEFGESAPSKIAEVRIARAQSQWKWIKAGTTSEITNVADLCADQLVLTIPTWVWDTAIASGATRWNLYSMAWSDQDPVPVEATLVKFQDIYPDETSRLKNSPLSHSKGGWLALTPARKIYQETQPLPTRENRVNYADPPRTKTGLVAGDRVILVGDAESPARIRWSSNQLGDYTKFSASKGGGEKVLSSGNLHIPGSVVLWQNPQSVDTLTILCVGSDGTSICYYMSPAEVTGQSSSNQVMGFEETTNTPGSMSPYGALVHNNALYRPIDRALLKSTAQNYNINHKSLSDEIQNNWEDLQDKQWIMSAVLDNRLYFVVNNPRGEPIEDGCNGNEIWVYDLAAGEAGAWSRFLVQAVTVRVIEYGPRVYMGVIRPDGVYYLDPEARMDDYVLDDGTVGQRPIPWFFETNTQGANRAHDAWAHLQQVSPVFGDFYGTIRYGIRGRTVNGKEIDISKEFEDLTPDKDDNLSWDVEDHLLVRRDLKEWFFYCGNVEGKPGSGHINLVQYRYTPVSVNVGYEYGSVETFEYGRNVAQGADGYSQSGVPRPVQNFPYSRM